MAGTKTDDLAALRAVELFSGLDDERLAALALRCRRREFARGEVVWVAGDDGDELLVVTAGELEVVGPAGEVIGLVQTGECCGEMAVLLDERRSATVRAGRATKALSLHRAAFRDLVADDPRILPELTKLLSRRAAALARRRPVRRNRVTIGVLAEGGVKGATTVSDALRELAGRVVGVGGPAGVEVTVEDLGRVPVESVEHSYDAVVVVGRRVVEPGSEPSNVYRVVNRFDPEAPRVPVNRSEPFIVPFVDDVALLHDPTHPAGRTLGRLTRRILGVSVGLALGGGAAFGVAHVGVILAFEDAGLPIDLVAGTSMGSIVAMGWAAGLSGAEMHAIAQRIGNVRTTLSVLEPALTGTGIINSRRVAQIFAPLIEASTFEELVSPCRVVATDVGTGERVQLGSGDLAEAFRASCAIPLVFTPSRLDGRTLVDGAMCDPVPVEVAREMGADVVVGVNVVPHLDPDVTTSISRLVRRANRFNPLTLLAGGREAPSLVDVLMNSLQIVQRELGHYKAASGDLVVDVELPGFTWIEFYRAMEIVEQGRLAGEKVAKELHGILAERVGTAP